MADFDLLIIGAGPGGYVCAIRAAQLGMKVALVERRARAGTVRLGGTCLNVGCIPSKALLDSSERFHDAASSFAAHGIQIPPPQLDLARMMARKDQVVQTLVDGVAFLMRKHKITVLTGEGRLRGTGEVSVTGADGAETVHRATHIVLAMGSAPIDLPMLPQDGTRIISSDQAIALPQVPRRLLVVGGGVIGLELGSVWRRLGAEVAVIEFLPQILPFLDPDVAQEAGRILGKQGLTFHLQTKVTGVERREDGVTLVGEGPGGPVRFEGDVVLVAVGRRPLSEQLAGTGVALDERKRVRVDARFRTSLERVYAIGDLIPGPMLAHKAEEEGVALAELLAGQQPQLDHHLIPNVIYTWPEIASVGMTEAEARARGEVRIGRFPVAALGRARAAGETEGSVKIIADARSDRILGAAIIAPRASDLLAEITGVMAFGGASEDIARTCHAHPTFSEGVKEAALAVLGRALHA